MTGEKRTETNMDANSLCIRYYHSMTLPTVQSYTMHAGRGGVIRI